MKLSSWPAAVALLTLLAACSGGPSQADPSDSPASGGEATASGSHGAQGDSVGAGQVRDLMAGDYGEPPAEDVERVAVPVDGAPVRGASQPTVTLVVFSDFQCPFCGRLEPTLARLRSAYPEDLAVVFRHLPLPFHEHAQEAAELSEVAYDLGGNEAFWRVHGLLFQNQRDLEREDLLRYAAAAGLDPNVVAQRLDAGSVSARVDASARMAALLGISGTPSTFVNGRPIVGAQPYEAFDAVVRQELALAAREASQGLDRRGLYARRIAGAATRLEDDEPPAAARREPDPDVRMRVPIGNQPSRGPADALVTIVEFSDFQCPFCAHVEPTLQALRERYGDDLRIVWRNNPLPFHQNARPAAVAAMEAYEQGGNDAFWHMHDALFADQTQLDQAGREALFRRTQLDLSKLRRNTQRHTHDAAIDEDIALAARVGATGTPIFFINGRSLRGAQPLPAFTAAVDAALIEARAAVQQGTPRAAVYEALMQGALADAPTRAPRPDARAPEPDRVYDIAVPSDAPSRGPADAPVVIQQFSDFQCPFCSRVEPTLAHVREVYGDRVRWVWRNYPLPFHEHAMPAAVAAMEVFRQGGAAKFWAYHDLLFANQRDLSDEHLVQWAGQLGGIRTAAVRRALGDSQASTRINAEMDPMSAAGAQIGTPSFLINGHLLQGAQPFEAFQQAIDQALQESAPARR